MAGRELTRSIRIPSPDGVRWERLWMYAFFAFLILNVGVAYAIEDAPDVVHTIQAVAVLLVFAGLVSAAVVPARRFTQRFRLVFTTHWIEPGRINYVLVRLDIERTGILSFLLRPLLPLSMVTASLIALARLLQWLISKINPGSVPFSMGWAVVHVVIGALIWPLFLCIGLLLDLLFPSPRTIGFDSQWMGFVDGRPGRGLWRYDEVQKIQFDTVHFGEERFRVMIVTARDGRSVPFGLAEEVDVSRIAGILADKGVEVVG